MTLQQGAILHVPHRALDGTQTYLALGGSLQITGSPCFSSGTISTISPSEVDGSSVDAAFLMDDGSMLNVSGFLTDTTANSIAVKIFNVRGGQCSGLYFFGSNATLRR